MCGIVGIASATPVESPHALEVGRDILEHRGPDSHGVWWSEDRRVGLGHRRLAIIDLSAGGHQPMSDVEGESVITFNGEIYNYRELAGDLKSRGHRFRTASDTEVILAAYREWGVDCIKHFNGQFALALYDVRRRRLFLARDRAGEKPLFYAVHNGTLRFASELKALMADPQFPRYIDPEALDCFLAMGFVPGDRCILTGVHKLPPAHALTFDIDEYESKVWRYWFIPSSADVENDETADSQCLDELETLLEGAVRRQLVADVPVGILLSGGVDSSLVTAMAVRARDSIKTFSVRFPGFGSYDETDHARLIARHFHTDHVELEAGEVTEDVLFSLARQFDEPIVDSSMIPTFLVSKLVRQYCTVALGGDGGDELFAGYPHYDRMLWMQHRLRLIPRFAKSAIATMAERALPIGCKGRNWLQGMPTDLHHQVPFVGRHFDRRARQQLMNSQVGWRLVAEQIRETRIPASDDLLQRATRMDFENFLAEDILVKIDRASMLTSLEVRAPFLDLQVIEFAFGRVPSRLKARIQGRKILLKQLCDRVLPPSFNQQRKQGFSIPLPQWLQQGPWLDFFRDILLGPGNDLFDRSFVRRLFDGQAKGRVNSERLFALLIFELWRREYGVVLGGEVT